MTRKKSNVKALALAVTCAILAGGGIGLKPVYAAEALYKEASGNVTTATKNGETDNTIINELTVGGVKIGSEDSFTGISIGSNSTSNHVIISDNDILASGAVHASVISSGLDARMEGGKLVAKNGLYIGATDITNPTNENSKFYVSGESGNVVSKGIVYAKGLNVAAGKFSVDDGTGNVTTTGALKGKTLGIGGTANDRFTVDENGKTVVTGGKGTVTIDPAGEGIVYERKEANQRIQLDSGYVKASGYVEAPKFSIDGDNFFMRNEQGSQLLVSDSKGRVNIGDGTITATSDVNVGGTLCTNKILNATPGEGVTVDGVKFKAGAVSGISDINDGIIKFSKNGTKDIVQINSDLMFNDDAGQQAATLTLEGVKTLNGLSNGSSQIKAGNGSVVGGVTFDQGKVTNVVSINDNLKFESDGVYLNKGDQAKQIKIGTDGKIIIGTSSSAYDTNGFYAGGHDYNNAKAAIRDDGSIKGANGEFSVEGATGDTTVGGNLYANKNAFVKGMLTVDGNAEVKNDLKVKGDIEGTDITATGALKGDSLEVTNNAAVGGDLAVTKNIKGQSLNIGVDGSEFTVDAGGNMTSKSAKIGSVGIDNTGAITGVTSLTTKALTVTGAFTTDGNLTVHGDLTASGAINGKTISINDGGSIAGVSFATGGKLTAATGTIGDVTFAAGGVVSGVKEFTSAKISDGAGTIITGGNVESKTAKIGAIKIENETIEGSSANGLTIENVKIKDGVVSDVTSLTANSATIGGVNTLDNTGITVATGKKIQVGSKTVIEDGSIAVSTNTKLTDQALTLNTTNTWTAAGGLVADKATVNGVVLGADATKGKATFTDANGKVTTISGDKITTGTIKADELLIDKISLGKDGSSNISIDNSGNVKTEGEITIKDATTGEVMSKLSQDKATFGKDAMNQTTISKGDITATAKNAADSQQSTLTHNNKGFKVEGKDAGGTNASSFGFDTSTGIGTFTGQDNSTTAIDGSNMTLVNGDNKTKLTAGGATFTGKDYKDANAKGTTVIDGNTITTGKLVTDELVITGQGNADGNGGSIAFGGNGTIKSDINDGQPNGKNTSFETTLGGVNTKVTDGTTTTENKVTAAGNSNTVTKDDKHKSEFNQGLTSIGGVVTNGEIKVAQKLNGETGLITNEVTDANGKSSTLEQSGTGLTYTDSANTGNATRIDSSDVSIGSATDPEKRINLSDLGQIDELDQEIRDNEVYKSNETAVGGINAEAAIRRGEVERLDNRISEEVTRLDGRINDVNDRVNKVGAMAAAIASLKSIGYDPQAPSEFSIGLGQYKGETGVAMGFFHYPNKNFMINVSLSTAGGETMGGIGATWRFGHKSPQKLLEEQREAQAKKELAAAEKYQAAAKLAKEAQERAEYAAKLARQAQVSADNAKAAADATQAKHFG